MAQPDIIEELASSAHQTWLDKQPIDRVSIKFGHNIVTDWNNLDESWKKEQYHIFEKYAELLNETSDQKELSKLVHNVWMELNSWEKDHRPNLFKPYDELSPEEQQKDIDVVNILVKYL